MNKYRFPESSRYTGAIFEEEVIGHCKAVWCSGYMSFESAMEHARNNQPEKLPPCALRLRDAVAKQMEVEPSEIKLFTAVKSALDKIHSVDGWFEYQGFVVTFDVTISETRARFKDRTAVVIQMENPDIEDLSYQASDVAHAFKFQKRMAEDRSLRKVLT